MTTSRALRAAAAASLLILLSACAREGGGADSAGAGAGGKAPGAPGAVDSSLALRIEYVGGFLPPDALVGRLPAVSVYQDGQVIYGGPQIAIYPGPALPNLLVRHLAAAEVDKLTQRALDAGVGGTADLGRPAVADVPSTRFTVVTDAGTKQTEVYALGEGTGTGLTAAQQDARAKLRAFAEELTAAGGKGEEPYEITAVAALASGPLKDTVGMGKQVAWPGPALPGERIGQGRETYCVLALGADAQRVLAAAKQANASTPWMSGGRLWAVTLRPLLPDEAGCADLARAS